MVALSLSNRLKKPGVFRETNVISRRLKSISLAAAAVGLFYATAPALAQQKTITVWFGKGFYKSEDDALLEAIKKFEAKTGIKVELSQYAIQDMIPKTVAALDSGTVFGIMSWMAYCDSSTLMPVLASNFLIASRSASVSYTHLTLPTIYSV